MREPCAQSAFYPEEGGAPTQVYQLEVATPIILCYLERHIVCVGLGGAVTESIL